MCIYLSFKLNFLKMMLGVEHPKNDTLFVWYTETLSLSFISAHATSIVLSHSYHTSNSPLSSHRRALSWSCPSSPCLLLASACSYRVLVLNFLGSSKSGAPGRSYIIPNPLPGCPNITPPLSLS